jgi:hypothetical protein
VAQDDFRIRIQLGEDHEGFLERLGLELGGEAAEVARELEQRKLVVSRDGDEIFVYAATRAEAVRAGELIDAVLREHEIGDAEVSAVEQWFDDEDRWSDEPPGETWEEEELDHGYAPWEVRLDLGSREAADELAEKLEAEGYRPVRRWSYLIVGTSTREDAERLAERLHGQVEPGGELVWETMPGNPFAVFGGMGSSGTPGG